MQTSAASGLQRCWRVLPWRPAWAPPCPLTARPAMQLRRQTPHRARSWPAAWSRMRPPRPACSPSCASCTAAPAWSTRSRSATWCRRPTGRPMCRRSCHRKSSRSTAASSRSTAHRSHCTATWATKRSASSSPATWRPRSARLTPRPSPDSSNLRYVGGRQCRVDLRT